uniref:AlNc14C197G8587 protein n=1 Tax=Albugo laibachii Nc14 TaxID=890382 RepID=F0WQA6_9STRA|nr:AlNc14C197G8587 [Albugo laibachii Nc14]|eukprot:CCA23514.1 AlNc14C197G8587 [Albugo laibachii Nc14]
MRYDTGLNTGITSQCLILMLTTLLTDNAPIDTKERPIEVAWVVLLYCVRIAVVWYEVSRI